MEAAPHRIVLADATDFEGFRDAARALAAQGIAPDQVVWAVEGEPSPPLVAESIAPFGAGEAAFPGALRVPPSFIGLCATVVLHRDPARFHLMYRVLWRLMREPALRHDPLDPDMVLARHMEQSVRRDMHKMTAFVRFRPVAMPVSAEQEAAVIHVAWFEPDHYILAATAPFFMRRFAQMRWAILTPDGSARWDGHALEFGPGGQRADAPPADAGEAHWLTYYASIFNPARLKLDMMRKEMPRKYWHNLPEAVLIAPLASAAAARTGVMVEQPPTVVQRRLPDPVAIHLEVDDMSLKQDGIRSLKGLRAATDRCRECPIGEYATQSVCGEGPLGAPLMFVGEQPGDQEDLRGRPFVGPAGQLFDRALAEIGLARETIFISNAVRHFKFELRGKRRIHKTPSQQEAAACLHWLEDEIELVKPAALVALGATAARSLMGRPVPVLANRGKWLVRPDGRKVMVTLHPSALLRTEPDERESAFRTWVADLRQAADGPTVC